MGATGTSADPLIPVFDLQLADEDLEAVADVLRSGWLTMGPRTEALEQAFAAAIGVRHAVAVSSCTAALHLAYLAAGIGPGDEVIVPSFTMVATAAAVLHARGTPVFADIVSAAQPLIDPDHAESLIGARTRALVAMHFGGYAADLERLRAIASKHNLALIEDVAHAPLATHAGRSLGTWGLAGGFSFFSNKVLPAGEGGLLATNDDAVADFARSRRSHAMTTVTWDRHQGSTKQYDVPGLGFNYRIDEPRSALLLSRLRRLAGEIVLRRQLTLRYRELLAAVPGITVPFGEDSVAESACYVMPVMIDDADRRDAVRLRLRERHRVQTSVFYPAIHRFSAYRERFTEVRLPATEAAARREITLPLFVHMSDADQDRVVAALAEEVSP